MTGTTASTALKAMKDHPHYRYRGCAPDPDNPRRAQGNPELSVDAWHGPDADGGEGQRDRRVREEAAKRVCGRCPLVAACDAYASSVVGSGSSARLAEPRGVWGGRTALERHRRFIGQRHEVVEAAPAEHLQTVQKQAVLQALAVHVDPEDVARAAGVDWRTASWQRSRLVTQFSLDKSRATRAELLREAVRRGLLDAGVVVEDDGTVPAVPPAPPRDRGRRSVEAEAGPGGVRFGQLSLDDILEPAPAVVTDLYPSARLEAAA
jgi:hypothetical protein